MNWIGYGSRTVSSAYLSTYLYMYIPLFYWVVWLSGGLFCCFVCLFCGIPIYNEPTLRYGQPSWVEMGWMSAMKAVVILFIYSYLFRMHLFSFSYLHKNTVARAHSTNKETNLLHTRVRRNGPAGRTVYCVWSFFHLICVYADGWKAGEREGSYLPIMNVSRYHRFTYFLCFVFNARCCSRPFPFLFLVLLLLFEEWVLPTLWLWLFRWFIILTCEFGCSVVLLPPGFVV